jgi:hypothetical protein
MVPKNVPPGPVVTRNRTNHVINHKEFAISNDCINYRDNSELHELIGV